jgi:signal transduction histidine kinase
MRAPVRLGDGSPQAQVIEARRPLLLAEATALSAVPALARDAFPVRAALLVPLMVGGEVIGVLTLLTAESGRTYDFDGLSFAEEIARRVATAIDNAQLYRRAQRAVRAREDVLSIVSHDLKNQLSAIMMGVAAITQAAPSDERRKERRKLEIISRAGRRMERMTSDLLDLSSIEAGHLAVEPDEVEVEALLGECAETWLPLARDKGLALEVAAADPTLRVTCDRERVQQVFANLIGNALKFTPAGPESAIRIAADPHGAMVLFSVRDTGPGIPRAQQRHLFNRYWQAEETARRGRGLGLYIAKGIVELLGGSIWVESKSSDGAAFFFTLPCADEPREPPPGRQLSLILDGSPGLRGDDRGPAPRS